MGQVAVRSISESAVHAVVTRADGKVENLGLIAYTSQNPLKRWAHQLGRLVGIWRR